ncbi:hypothetical protein [Sanguibacter sp. Z1732]|uniref:hypothetical protein n=1 Tax=Sanguibacter sp. Z1732 TaxID=3435412 RepID=UPI003D9CACED
MAEPEVALQVLHDEVTNLAELAQVLGQTEHVVIGAMRWDMGGALLRRVAHVLVNHAHLLDVPVNLDRVWARTAQYSLPYR